MFTYLALALAKLGEMISSNAHQSSLERYIESQNPSNAAEVDHYIREFDRMSRRRGAL